ncbi:MAG: topoisomerase DNA-binding C4 zinc finger domain-containing protein [Lachnospiraceae bacterium]|nr:topoisomerase DNA-binding C4 zinc finger domain-containing protein [Lachnospiraceae bacterium]
MNPGRAAANICPRCGGELIEKNGRYGKFMGCRNYPDCRYSRKL